MRLRRDLLGIVLTFSVMGTFASGLNSQAYEEVYNQQTREEKRLKEVLSSEFINPDHHQALSEQLETIQQAEKRGTRRELKAMIKQEKELVSVAQASLGKNEEKVAVTEYAAVVASLATLTEKSQEKFITVTDLDRLAGLKTDIAAIASSKKVEPIRRLANDVGLAADELKNNQRQLISQVELLKVVSQDSGDLAEKEYLSTKDKEKLVAIQVASRQFFDHADDLSQVGNMLRNNKEAYEELLTKQSKSAEDFNAHLSKTNKLITDTESLLLEGQLNQAEKTELEQAKTKLTNLVNLSDYEPGDLAKNYEVYEKSYTTHLKSSDQRLVEEAKKVAEATKKAEREEAKRQAETQASSPSLEPTLVGDWYQAPQGHKFLKAESGKTYGQVKNPGNFQLITVTEASNYTPGHGNGSAKQ